MSFIEYSVKYIFTVALQVWLITQRLMLNEINVRLVKIKIDVNQFAHFCT